MEKIMSFFNVKSMLYSWEKAAKAGGEIAIGEFPAGMPVKTLTLRSKSVPFTFQHDLW